MSFPTYPEYKDSGVEWLGDIPIHWEIKQLRHCLQDSSGLKIGPFGSQLTSEMLLPEGFKVYGQENVIAKDFFKGERFISSNKFSDMAAYKIEEGDILVTMMGSSGRCAVVPKNIDTGIMDSHLLRIKVNERSFAEYIAILLSESKYVQYQFQCLGKGSIMHGLNSSIIKQVIIAQPSFNEQSVIVSFLAHETAKIDALTAEQETLIELLKEKRQAVISHAVTKGLDPNAPMKDSGVEWLGRVPEHWHISPIKYAIRSIEQGWSPQCENFPVEGDEEWGVLKVGCVNGGKFNPIENKALPNELEPLPNLGLLAGDVLISRANTKELVGSAAVVDTNSPRLLLCDKLYRLRTHTKQLLPVYLVMLLGTREARSIIELSATGASSSMQNIGQSTILELEIPLPPVDEQESIVRSIHKQCEPLETLLAEAQHAISLLKERRSALISAAVTGKIDVRGYAPQPEAA